MAPSWAANRHVVVLLVAMVVGAYHMLRLEQRRADRDGQVDVEFDRAVALLRAHLMHHQTSHGDYQILIASSKFSPTDAAIALSRTALVVNRAPPVPRIEAELVVDTSVRNKPVKDTKASASSKARGAKMHGPQRPMKASKPNEPLLKFLVYDSEAMRTAAAQLEQRELARVVRHGPPVESQQ